VSLVVVELASKLDGTSPARVLRVGFRNGVMLPPEEIWEGDQRFVSMLYGHEVVGDRYLVTHSGGVIDLQEKRVINNEQDGEFDSIEGTKVIYRLVNDRRKERGVYSFDLATGTLRKESKLGEGKYGLKGVRSPDGRKAVETGVGSGRTLWWWT
jgi:hypothetical protein